VIASRLLLLLTRWQKMCSVVFFSSVVFSQFDQIARSLGGSLARRVRSARASEPSDLYVWPKYGSSVRCVWARAGRQVTTLAGASEANGTGAGARFNKPYRLALDERGRLIMTEDDRADTLLRVADRLQAETPDSARGFTEAPASDRTAPSTVWRSLGGH